MTQSDRLIFGPGPSGRRPANGLVASVMWLGGLVATLAAMAVGAVLVFVAGLAVRARRRVMMRNRRADDVIEARKVDGAWVAYGWERPGR